MKLRNQSAGGTPRPMEVWNANVYFDDGSGAKNRPVIVLEKRGDDFTVYMVTSHPRHPNTDVRLMDPYEVMLDRTSHVRTDRPFKLPASKFNYRLGTLCYDDAEMMRAIFESRTKDTRMYRRGNYRGDPDSFRRGAYAKPCWKIRGESESRACGHGNIHGFLSYRFQRQLQRRHHYVSGYSSR